ncbi:Subtilisin-like protease SBT1.9 [Glycine max]|nr:Subtilisin-like protease SBT1.9 [Glycine max]
MTFHSFRKCETRVTTEKIIYGTHAKYFNCNVGKKTWKRTNGSRAAQEFQRTVTNVGDGQTIYVASIAPVKGYHVSVNPKKLVFEAKNEKQSYKLRIEGPRKKKEKNMAHGYLAWAVVKHVVRSPIVVTTLTFDF